MSPPWLLIAWNARRCWPPAACALYAAVLATALVLPWTSEVERSAPALSADVEAGLARQGIWVLGGALVLIGLAARSASSVHRWRQGEGAWLGGGRLSRGGVALAQSLGLALALAMGLLPLALVGEARAGARSPPLRWLADTDVGPIVLFQAGARSVVPVEAPPKAAFLEARFVVAAPGDGGPTAILRASFAPEQGAPAVREQPISTSTRLRLDLPEGAVRASLSFERVGPGAALVLEGRRVSWFAREGSAWESAACLALHAWLAGSVAATIALAVGAWASPGTAFLAALAALAGAWLAADAPGWIPGVGLRDALAWCADGHGPGFPTLGAWLGWLGVQVAALSAVAVQRDLWRRTA